MRYDAFISYSHAADGRLAPALQRALQRLAKPWFRRRSLEVFRDETGLGVDPHLWGSIVRALDESEWFLLLASPQAADSAWVNREVEHWKANRSLDRMLPVLTEGRWQWDQQTGDFTADSDAVPPELRGVFIDEPRHLDLRWAHDAEQLDLRNSRFRDAVAEVAAPLHGRTKDDIEGEDVRQHRRTVRIARSAAAALIILTAAAFAGAGIAVRNANRAEQSRIRAESQRLAAQSGAELERPDLAFLLAAHGYRMDDNVQTRSALLTALADMPEFKRRIQTDSPVNALAASAAANRLWIGTATGDVTVRRFSDGAELAHAEKRWEGGILALAPARAGSDQAVLASSTSVVTVDADLRPAVVRQAPNLIMSLAVDPSTGRVAAGTNSGDVVVWEPDGSEPTAVFKAWDGESRWASALAWTTDSGLLVAGQYGRIRRFDLDLPGPPPVWEQSLSLPQETAWVSAMTVLADGNVVVGGSDGTVGFMRAGDGSATPAGQIALHTSTVNGLAATGDAPVQGSVASVSDDGFLIFWNHLTGRPVTAPIRTDEQDATAVAWDPADKSHGVAGGSAGGAVLLDYSPDRRRPLAKPIPGWKDAFAVALSGKADRLAVATAVVSPGQPTRPDSRLTLTSAARPDPDGPSVVVKGLITKISFTPDGSRVLAGTTDGTVVVWDGTAERPSVTRVGPGDALQTELSVAPDGATVATRTRIASLDSAPTKLWRLSGAALVEKDSVDGPFGSALAFTPDGSSLAIGGIDKVLIHRLDGGESSIDISGDMSSALAFAPDGTTLAIGLASGPIRLIDTATGKQTGDDLRVAAPTTDLAFADEDQLVSTSSDGSIIFWDLPSRTRLADKPLTAVDRDPAGRTIRAQLAVAPHVAVTASGSDGLLVMWPLDPVAWIDEGCSVHDRELTDAESARYGLSGAAPVCTGQR